MQTADKLKLIRNYIYNLISFSPRQFKNETLTARFIINELNEKKVEHTKQCFALHIPRTQELFLMADKKKVLCKSCSLRSGQINSKSTIISSLLPSAICNEKPNINFNPCCKEISLANFYFAPSFAVSHNELKKILIAKSIQGKIKIKKLKHQAVNILVGNYVNPKNIIFSHYDSIEKGAIDNASGVAVMLAFILKNRNLLKDNLFVFSACEELSFDKPVYWGAGYRFFEKKYKDLMKKCRKIIVIDSVGGGKTQIFNSLEVVKLGFPVKNLDKFIDKIKFIAGSLEDLMAVYHSNLDDGRNIKDKFLKEAYDFLLKEIKD